VQRHVKIRVNITNDSSDIRLAYIRATRAETERARRASRAVRPVVTDILLQVRQSVAGEAVVSAPWWRCLPSARRWSGRAMAARLDDGTGSHLSSSTM